LTWIEFFLRAVIHQAESNLNLVRQITALYDQKKHQITGLLRSDKSIHIVDLLFDSPVFRAAELHDKLGIQRQRAAQYIRVLREAGVVTEIRPAPGRKSAILSFEELWEITG
jgi:Fic family protein